MTRVYADPTEVFVVGQRPVRFTWRGRLYTVQRVSEHWVTVRDWWQQNTTPGTEPGPVHRLEFWRVEATPEPDDLEASGFELRHDLTDEAWLLSKTCDLDSSVQVTASAVDGATADAATATDCEGVDAMQNSTVPKTTRRPAFLNKDDVLSQHPYTGGQGQWTVALPPVIQGEDVWVNVRDSDGKPAVFVIEREHEVPVIDGERAGIINGLRELADFIEAHPDLPVNGDTVSFFPENKAGIDTTEAAIAEVARIADILGVEPGPKYNGDPHHHARRTFGSMAYEAVVCNVHPDPTKPDKGAAAS